MQIVLAGLARVQPFIDDIIVHSTSVTEHLNDLELLFQRLVDHGMKLVPKKVHVGCRHVKFLGHVVGVDGIRPDPTKVQALLDMPTPTNVQQLRSWLGLANYYRRFVKGMSKLIAPLTKLLTKGTAFDMGPEQCKAMREVNETLALHTLMRYPDHAAARDGSRPFIVATDACKDGLGAVLSQADEHGVEQPIAFTSRTTLPSERNWSTTDLEAGAIIFGIKKFRHILWGAPFTLYTDHRALQFMESLREKTSRGARWSEFLSAFQVNIKYKKGASNSNADGPSRNAAPATAADVEEQQQEQLLEAYSLDSRVTDRKYDEVLACWHTEITHLMVLIDEAMSDIAGEAAAEADTQHSVNHTWSDIAQHHTLGLLTAADWQHAQQADEQLALIIACLHDEEVIDEPPGTAATARRWAKDCELRSMGSSQVLVRLDWPQHDADHTGTPLIQLVVPKSLRAEVLESMHGSAWAGHQGRQKTLARARQHVWWPSWTADVEYWVRSCWPCQARKHSGKLSSWPLVWRDRPPFAFHTVGIDFFGPLPASAGGHTHILVLVDLYSGWVELYALKSTEANAAGVAEVLVQDFSTRHGVPLKLLSDRGSQFMAELSRQVYHQMGLCKLSTTAFHPQTNGKTERFMQTMAQMLAMVADSAQQDWHRWLRHVAFAYNSSEHAVTGSSPFLLAMGREPHLALHSLLGRLRSDSIAAQAGSVHELVVDLMHRQRRAESVMDRRKALQQQHVIKTNAHIASAFGLRQQFRAGQLVWVYRQPRTYGTTVASDAHDSNSGNKDTARVIFSRKLLDKWQGPYQVINVGPWTSRDGKTLVQRNCLLLDIDGRHTRVSMHQCKTCHDPTDTLTRPHTLPNGFARYLIAKTWHTAQSPGSLSTDDVSNAPLRYGVEAIIRHRLVTGTRGRGRKLEYLVRWEGDSVVDSWEPAHYLDSCPQALEEYWAVTARQNEVTGSNIQVVKEQLRRARREQGVGGILAKCTSASALDKLTYKLSPASVIVSTVTLKQLRSAHVIGMSILQVYEYAHSKAHTYLRWCEGIVRHMSSKGKYHKIYWYESCSTTEVCLPLSFYNTQPNSREGSWFLFGTAQQVDTLRSA